jgi:peptide/nickel transport system permease protein
MIFMGKKAYHSLDGGEGKKRSAGGRVIEYAATGILPPRCNASAAVLATIAVLCAFAGLWLPDNPVYMDFGAINLAPGHGHPFGTDQLGRDLFRMVFYGGRVSLFIGVLAAGVAALIAVVYGAASGLAGKFADNVMMRVTELLLSIPSILYVVSIQAILGRPTALSIALVIGATSWMNIAKIVRGEVRQMRKSEYVTAAAVSGAKLPYILRRHLFPNFLPPIMFMIISNVSQAVIAEATLSFIGIGLPQGIVSWGTLIALSQDALLTNSWWIILVPVLFLITVLVCIANIGESLRKAGAVRTGYLD